jgi:hypothetical protein
VKKTSEPIKVLDSVDSKKQDHSRQWNEYFAKANEFRSDESLWMSTIQNIHVMQRQAMWFAEHTPIPFKSHFTPLDTVASLSTRYLCELACGGNEHALREAGRIAIQMCELLDELLHGESPVVDERARTLQHLAEGLPYWPILHFKHVDREKQQTEEEVFQYFRRWAANPKVRASICGDCVTAEEREERMRQVFGLASQDENNHESNPIQPNQI